MTTGSCYNNNAGGCNTGYGFGNSGFALLVVLFILLVIVGSCWF